MGTATWEQARKRYGGGKSVSGRDAEKPSEMTAKGWKDTLWRVKDAVTADRVTTNAAAMSYYSLLALVPALTSLVLLYAFFSNPEDIQTHISSLPKDLIPPEIMNIITNQLQSLAGDKNSTGLGIGAFSAIFFALWSASKGSNALMDALNVIYDEKNERGFFMNNLMAIGLTLLATVIGIVAIGVMIFYPNVIKFLPLPSVVETWAGIGSWVLLLLLFSFYLAVAYRYGPYRTKAEWKWVSWGAVIASVLWAIVSAGFSFYASEFGSFNKTYGSMSAIVVLMMWLYLSSLVILFGAEINAELEHQTFHDTTGNPDERMGRRGAHMADTIGKSHSTKKKS